MTITYREDLTPVAAAVRGKAWSGAFLYICTIVVIWVVPVGYRLPRQPDYPLGEVNHIFTPSDNAFLTFLSFLMILDCIACAITAMYLFDWARKPARVDPSSFYYTYIPYWAHFFMMYVSIFVTLTACVFQDTCWLMSPLGLVLVAIGLVHLASARLHTRRIRAARRAEQSRTPSPSPSSSPPRQ